ncbi:MAG: PQQ-binding-like beta-propeller repeat protein [Candidatus Bathyarchaeota archaeon]|nr:PQQ-binding-like beta-propeller repeat protein [Candidatus Bathyarchaeota archaeon]
MKLKIATFMALFALALIITSFAMFPPITFNVTAQTPNPNETSILTESSLLQYEWPQLQGNPSATRFSEGPAPEAPDILWQAPVDGLQSYAAAFNGKIFVTTTNHVIALDKDTGKTLWTREVSVSDGWISVYKIDDTCLVAGSSCLNTETGKVLWVSGNFSAAATNFASGCYSPTEKMFYTQTNSSVHAWNFSDPTKPPVFAWNTYVAGLGEGGSSLQYGDGKVFVGSFIPHQVALDAKTGDVLWDKETKASMLFAGSYADGKFFRGGAYDNTFYCFDASNGDILWTSSPETSNGYWCSGSAVAYGMVYALNKDGYLYAMDTTDGSVVWKYNCSLSLFFPGYPVVADGKVYATTSQRASFDPSTNQSSTSQFACLDAFSGNLVWTLPIEAHAPRESVAVAYGRLYIIPGYVNVGALNSYITPGQVWALGTQPWNMYRRDAQHTAVGQSGPTNLTLTWAFATSGAVASSPSAVDGRIYVGSQDNFVYCLDARSGSLVWKFKTGDRIESSPAVFNGSVYIVSDDGYLYSLNATDGNSLWTRYIGSDFPAVLASAQKTRSSPVVVKGRVYVGSMDSNLYCIDAQTGNVIWKYLTSGFITSSPAVADGSVYVSLQEAVEGALYKIDTDGFLVWRIPLLNQGSSSSSQMYSSPVVSGTTVFVSSSSMLYKVDGASGYIVWTYRNPEGDFLVGSPVCVNNKLFLIDNSFVVCLDASSSLVVWKAFIGPEFSVSPTYADGKLYVASGMRAFYVLNASDGERLSWFVPSSNFWSSPTIYEGRVYVGNQDWNVYCLADYPALGSNLTLSLGSSEAFSGDLMTGWGQLTPGIPHTDIIVTLTRPDGSSYNLTAETSATGVFTFTFQPVTTGNWSASAQWVSDKSFYTSAKSPEATLLVQAVPTPTPTETAVPSDSPSPSPSSSPTPTLVPFEQLTFAGIPLLYLYIAVVSALIFVIVVAAYIYRKKPPV